MRVTETNPAEGRAIPDDALEALARCLFPAIRSYFESEEGQREFAEWQQAQQDAKNSLVREVKLDGAVRLVG